MNRHDDNTPDRTGPDGRRLDGPADARASDRDENLAAPTGPLTSTDDPRLTAYALGEIDPADRTLVETFLAEHPDARAEVNEIAATARLLGDELAAASEPGLTDAQRATIDAAVTGSAAGVGAAAGSSSASAAGSPGSVPGGPAPASDGPATGPRASAHGGGLLSFPVRSLAAAAAALMIVVVGVTFLVPDTPGPAGPVLRADAPVASLADRRAAAEVMSPNARERAVTNRQADAVARQEGQSPGDDERAMRELGALGYLGGGRSSKSTPADDAAPADGAATGFFQKIAGRRAVDPAGAAYDDALVVDEVTAAVEASGEDAAFDSDALNSFVPPATDGAVGIAEAETFPSSGGLNALSGRGRPAAGRTDTTVLGVSGSARGTSTRGGGAAGFGAAAGPGAAGAGVAVLDAEEGDAAELGALLDSYGYVDADGLSEVAAVAPAPAVTPAEDPTQVERVMALGYVGRETRADSTDFDAGEQQRLAEQRERQRLYAEARRPRANAESYVAPPENAFTDPRDEPLSTFGVDVDTASYSNVRRFLMNGQLPPPSAVRLEELVNAFDLGVPEDRLGNAFDERPLAVTVESSGCPWAPDHRLARITLQARPPSAERPAANLVFLVDVSGSMDSDDKLPLLKSSMRLLVSQLEARDRVAIVTYNDSSRTTLPSTSCEQKDVILAALDGLRPGGSTNGEAGLRLAYQTAKQHFLPEGINRVFLATDGDFNVGASAEAELQALVTQSARSGVFLTVLGFGTGNLKDSKLEVMADHGNGHYAYIDTLAEGQRVLMEQAGSTLEVVAKDVKLQVEFNPGKVAAYRLLGYENRALAAQDFNDDRKDAGDVGAGHTVTAFYEIVPAGVPWKPVVDALRYQALADAGEAEPDPPAASLVESPELLYVKLRWKTPTGSTSQLFERPLQDSEQAFERASANLRFGAAVAGFGMLLRGSAHAGDATFASLAAIAEGARGDDPQGHRAEFVRLVKLAAGLVGE